MTKVVQYHRRTRIHIALDPGRPTRDLRAGEEDKAPASPRPNWTTAEWAVLEAWLPIILARGKAVAPGGMAGAERAIPRGRAQATEFRSLPRVTSFRWKSKRDPPPPGWARSGGNQQSSQSIGKIARIARIAGIDD